MTAGLCRALPYRAALCWGWLNAITAFSLARSRVETARQRIHQVFGDNFSRKDETAIAWQSWRNLIFNGVELMRVPTMTREWVESVVVDDSDLRELKAHCDAGQGAIIACPHMGNWEMAAVICHLYGIPIFNIAARQKNPLVNQFMNNLRRRPGIETIARGGGTMKNVIRRLRAGQVLAILPDVRMRSGGIPLPFLGGEANVGTGMALFARHTGVPILPCVVTRVGWDRHSLVKREFLYPDTERDKNEDLRRMTLAVLQEIDNSIRRDPGQWFWFNRRWILDPI
jgi:KDO2-lipid IV(A) lauroyltransferase